MRIVEQGVICAGERGGPRAVATFPGVTVLRDGSLLACYRVGATKDSDGSVTELRRSRDGGRNWSAAESPFSTEFGGVRGSLQVVYTTPVDGGLIASALWVDREAYPGQPLFHPQTEGCLPMKILVADSVDDGRSWTPWREVAMTADIGPPSLTNPVARMPDGRLILSIETNKPYLDASPWLQRVVHCESVDGGVNWTAPRTVCQDPAGQVFHWDQRLAVSPEGLAAFSWTYEKPANRYLPIRRHLSRDAGRTWRTDTLDFADQPSHPAVLANGRTVLAWVDRYGSRSIRARSAASIDGAFDPATEVVLYDADRPAAETAGTAGMLADMGLWSFGLPYAEALPDATVLVVYYAGSADCMDVRWARLAVEAGPDLYKRARRIIPGGTQLLSKRPEMFHPSEWPAYFSKARGAEVWDLDGRRYVDMSYGGIGACVLGYADPDVDEAVRAAIAAGSASTLNCAEEVELAELLCELHPWADMVRYTRCGGEAMAAAVRIARAKTRRDKIVFCGYHGWQDWYLAANLGEGDPLGGHLLAGLDPAGVPRGLARTALPFAYNDLAGFEKALAAAAGDLAAVVMEPMRSSDPAPGFLERVREETKRRGALLVFDEITAGFRLNTGGVHLKLGVTPDIAVFAKALGNGYPMAAIVGTGDAMAAAQATFISSTHWTERIGPAAALAAVRKHRRVDAAAHLMAIGGAVQAAWRRAAGAAGLDIAVSGIAPLSRFTFNDPDAAAVKTLFVQGMLERGFLASNAFYAMYAHTAAQVEAYETAVREVFLTLCEAIASGKVRERLRGPVAHSGFQRLAD